MSKRIGPDDTTLDAIIKDTLHARNVAEYELEKLPDAISTEYAGMMVKLLANLVTLQSHLVAFKVREIKREKSDQSNSKAPPRMKISTQPAIHHEPESIPDLDIDLKPESEASNNDAPSWMSW